MNQRRASAPWASINAIGSRDVAQVFAHLSAVLGQDVPEAEHGAVAVLVEDNRADRHQRVEPAAGLVDRLADEVGRELPLEDALVLERPVVLRVGHRARVEPDIDQVQDPAHHRGQRTARRDRPPSPGCSL